MNGASTLAVAAPLLAVEDLRASYGPIEALRGASLDVAHAEVVALIGANGAGKTTMLHAIVGLIPSRGTIVFDGRTTAGRPPEVLVGAGLVLVPERRALFDSMSVRDNLLLGAYHRRGKVARQELDGEIEFVYRLFPLLRDRDRLPARTLSGGMQQMLAIGRALLARPRLLLMDEPLLGLAPLVIREILRVIGELRTQDLSLLLVEQNANAAFEVASRTYVMEGGRIVLEGPSRELATNPRVQASYLGGHVD
ncbi:MAG: ABC transporter ATP-binding protein [Armatimonadota bacterium]